MFRPLKGPYVPVVVPTVGAPRSGICRRTVAQLHAHGFDDVLVSTTPPSVPHGPHGQGVAAQKGIQRALAAGADAVLHIEDDVRLSARCTPFLVQGLVQHGGVVLLYVGGNPCFHAPYGSLMHSETWVTQVQGQTHWYGCQAVLIPKAICAWYAAIPEDDVHALDFELRDYLDSHALPLFAVVPNVVQHLAPTSIGQQSAGRHTSDTYRDA